MFGFRPYVSRLFFVNCFLGYSVMVSPPEDVGCILDGVFVRVVDHRVRE